MPEPSQPPQEEPGTLLTRVGSAVGAALLAAALATIPATARMSVDQVNGAWVALASISLVPMLVLVLILRQARVGVRAFGGPGSTHRVVALALWLGTFAAVLMVLGAGLRATTHHQPLAGTTFAVVAVGVSLALAPLAWRVAEIVIGWRAAGKHLRLAGTLLLAFGVVTLLAMRAARAVPGIGGDAAAVIVDALAFAMAGLLASRPELTLRRSLALVGPPAAAVLLFVGMSQLTRSRSLAVALEERAPAFAAAGAPILRR